MNNYTYKITLRGNFKLGFLITVNKKWEFLANSYYI